MKILFLTLIAVILPLPAAAEEEHVHHSPYAGQELREIKNLSAADLADLKVGEGGAWRRPPSLTACQDLLMC
jgi:hypothetical protein